MKSLKKLEPAKIKNTHQIRGGKYWDTMATLGPDVGGNTREVEDHLCPNGNRLLRNA